MKNLFNKAVSSIKSFAYANYEFYVLNVWQAITTSSPRMLFTDAIIIASFLLVSTFSPWWVLLVLLVGAMAALNTGIEGLFQSIVARDDTIEHLTEVTSETFGMIDALDAKCNSQAEHIEALELELSKCQPKSTETDK